MSSSDDDNDEPPPGQPYSQSSGEDVISAAERGFVKGMYCVVLLSILKSTTKMMR